MLASARKEPKTLRGAVAFTGFWARASRMFHSPGTLEPQSKQRAQGRQDSSGVKVLATKSVDLSSIPKTHVV